MSYSVEINPHDPRPIWRQIEEEILRLVSARILQAKARIPSVPELASELTVNPATVSRAYQSLVAAGVLEVRRGEGTFVSTSPPLYSPDQLKSLLREEARRLVTVALSVGADRKDLEQALDRALAEVEAARTEERTHA